MYSWIPACLFMDPRLRGDDKEGNEDDIKGNEDDKKEYENY